MLENPIIDAEGRAELASLRTRVVQRAAAAPDSVALVHGARHLTYRALDRRAHRLAARLIADGLGPEERVGVAVDRSPELIVGMLAVQEAGGVYLPLDPSYPEERLAFMAADAGVERLLADRGAAELPFAHGLRRLDPRDLSGDEPAGGGGAAGEPDALAYVIYTSGSTGRPKGVMVPHGGLANLVEAEIEVFGTEPGDRVLQFAPASFDASVFEVAMALGAGAALVLAGRDEMLPGPGLARLLARERITRVTLPPSALAALPEEALPDLDTLISAGEALPGELVERWGAGRRMWNAFGPTETAVWATVGDCRRGEPRPPIGEAIPGLSVHLVDERLAPVAVGERGEIAVGGGGVARGYLKRPALTAERFLPDPFAGAAEEGARLYRTGDLGRRLSDGRIEYLGRADRQVKVRGHRVEPGEVEAVLGRHPAVRSCAVVAERDPVDPHGGHRLAGFVVLRDEGTDGAAGSARALTDAMRGHLAERLPSHLVPLRVTRLDELPLLPNGKVDRAALLAIEEAPGGERAEAGRTRRPPATATETALAAIWRELLGGGQPSLDDDLFELGGHSILVGRLISRVRRALGVELSARAVFDTRTLGAMAAAVDSAAEPPLPPIERAPRDRPLPLTFPQERIWFLEELAPANLAYNAQVCVHFEGSLDVRALARALAEVVRRHEVYRSRFFAVDATPFQEPLAAADCPVPLPVIDLSALPARRRDPERERRTREEIARPFDLSRPPLGRWTLFREAFDRTTLLQVEHHLAHDGWSFAVLLAELRRLYEAFAAGRPSPLPEVPVQVGDYAVWQRRLMSGGRLRRTLDYWRRRLAGVPPVLALPTDRPRPPVQSFRGDAVRFDLEPDLADGLRRLARDCGATLFGVMRAGFDTLLSRYTGEDDLVVGSGAANRRTEGSEAMIGMVVNTLPVRVELSGAPTFRQVVARVGEALVGAHAHEDVPFDRLVDALGVARDASRNPLVQVLFSFHDSPVPDLRFPGLVGRIAEQHNRTAKTDLNVVVIPRAEQRVGMMGVDRPAEARNAAETAVTVIWEYATDLFDRSTMERMTRCYRTLLEAAAAAPGSPALDLELLPPAERRQLLSAWRGRVGDYPTDASLADLFAARAAERPDAEALVTTGADRRRATSYGELAAAALRLARRLRQSGVRRGDRVALALDRSFDAVVAMIAVLRAGGAYVPLDPSYPAGRVRFMLEDSGVSRIVTRAEVLEATPALTASGLPWVPVEAPVETSVEAPSGGPPDAGDAPYEPVGGGDLAYVVYTSGSTGTPKAVAVPHRAVARLVLGTGYTPFGPAETLLHAAPVSFDAATYEVWGALLHGARLAVLPPGPQTPDRLAEAMARERPTALFLTTGLFNQLAEDRIDAFAPLAHLMTGGEAASPDHFRRVLAAHPELTVSNVYGPTENTTFSTHHPMRGPDEVREPVPIGGSIGHTTVLVADRGLRPVPVGVVGELLVGGDGLAWGYLGRPALTAERFVPDPFPPATPRSPSLDGKGTPPLEPRPPAGGGRVYRTGDLVRRSGRADLPGAIEFVGRNDSQVKVRGFRIEPGEVELALEAAPEVSEAIVVARELRGEKALVAYVVPSAGAGDGAAGDLAMRLRAHLADRLPAHAVPQAIMAVPRFPLTANGKVDRRALPDPETATAAAVGSVPPRGPIEEMVAAVWSEVLEHSPVGAHDDFFHLGGHSLAATRVVSRLRRMTGLDLPLVELFESPTVAGLALAIRSLGRAAGAAGDGAGSRAPILPPVPAGAGTAPYSAPASFAQERLWFLDRFEAEEALYNVPASVRLRGLLVPSHLRRALHDLESRHEGLRTVFAEERAAPGTPDGLAAGVRQAIHPPASPPLPVVDLSAIAPERRESELARAGRDDARRRFDLGRGPLWRARLVRLAGEEHALLFTLHHLITDGWSMTVLYRDLWELYEAAATGHAAGLPETAVRYTDFARWQREWIRGPVLAAEVDWWRACLAGSPPLLPLPLDRPRAAVRSGRGGRVSALLPPSVAERVRACGRTHHASLFMVLLAGLQAWLARATGEDDVPVGTPVANRGRAETEGTVGFFVNTLVLRTDLGGDPTFAELLERVRGVALAAFAHQELPFEKLVEALAPARVAAAAPLYQVSLALQNGGREVPGPPGIEVSRLPVEIPVAKLDLSLSFTEVAGGLELRVSYDRDIFDRTTVLRATGQLRALLWAAVLRPETRLSALPVVTAAERRALLEAAEGPAPRHGGEVELARSFHAAFRRWAERTPHAVALEEGEARWSYRALDRRASSLGARLRAAGVGPESRVALLAETSAEAIVALLGVHAAGGAFVPLDPAQPEERLRVQVADSDATAVLAGRGFDAAGIAGAAAVVPMDDAAGDEAPVPSGPRVEGDHLAYVSYTSGSTGRPKGVAVEHRQLLSYVAAIAARLELGPGAALATVSSLAADLGQTAVFPALATGGRLVVLPRETATDPAAAAHRHRDDLLKIVPSHLAALLSGRARLEELLPAHCLVLGGEALPRAVGAGRPTIPLGRPLPGHSVHVLDARLAPVPAGVAGEIVVGGEGVARGYLGRPGLTAERFLPDPFSEREGRRLYRTGDRGRRLPDGEIELLGRVDVAPVPEAAVDAADCGEAGGGPPPVARASAEERARPIPLSWAQRRLWFLHRMEERRPGSAYHVAQAIHLAGKLARPVLERALAEVVARHEALRTRIVESADGEAYQAIDPPPARCVLPTTDFQAVPEASRQAAVACWMAAETEQPFALGAEPPVRWRLARLGPVEHVLLVVAHHVAVDLGSLAVVYRELSALYRAFAEGERSPLPPPPLQYADWTLWQHRLAGSGGEAGSVLATQLAWWRERLAGAPAVLEVPSDRPRPAEQSFRGARVEAALDRDTAERLGAFCRQTGAAPFMALLAVFVTLLGRTAGRDELVVGTPVAGRVGEGLGGAVGLFANVLALRLDLGPEHGPDGGRTPGLADLAARVRSVALAADSRQDVPFEQVVDALEIERDLSRPPLVQVTFSVQDSPLDSLSLPSVTARALPSSRRSVQHDLALQVAGASGPEPRIALDYAADLYEEATARGLAERFVRLLAAGLADPEAPVDSLPWLSEAEERTLRAAGTGPDQVAAGGSGASTLHGRIAARAARHPARPAVGRGDEVVRYGELVAEARRIGHRLAALGVGAEAPVGVLLERTPAMVAALLGVLEAGGSYLPLDPGHPPERNARTLADSGARVLVTEEALADLIDLADPPNVRRVVIDGADREATAAAPATPVGAPVVGASRAYVIYTSGSTGRPKGVEVSHASVLAFLDAMARRPGLGAGDVALATTTIAFDISILEIFLPLVVGARVELVDRETAADGAALGERMRGVTVAQATPTSWRMLLDAGWKGAAAGGRAPRVLSGGEPLDRELAERLLATLGGDPGSDRGAGRETGELWNVYGPTETTVWSSAGRMTAEALAAGTCPIGEPIAGTGLYVVDPRGALCPPGVPGELRIGGAGVARGYLGRPALTAERFTPDAFASSDGAPGARSYRTGDLARWREIDGACRLECLGRIDQQVKIRGHRIEPGEIEAALTARPDVSRAVVAPFPRGASAGGRRLAAWLVLEPDRPEPTVENLRAGLEEALPPYMVPAAFVVLPELPLNANGKVDRNALPEPDGLRLAADAPYVEPSSEAEQALAAIWREVLGVDRVGIGDRFFHLGGDSILALQVAARAATAGWSLAVRDFFRHATLGELAAALRRATGGSAQALQAVEAPLPETLDFQQTGLSEEELDDLLDEIV